MEAVEAVAENKPIPITPVGYRMLIKPKQAQRQTAGGLYLPDETVGHEEILCNIGQVVAQGDACYHHPKFMDTRWCEVGDWVIFPKHAGTVVEVKNGSGIERYRLLNDDEITAVVRDPEAIKSYVA